MKDKPTGFLSVLSAMVLCWSLLPSFFCCSAVAQQADQLYEAQRLIAGGQLDAAEGIIVPELAISPRDPNWITVLAELRFNQRHIGEALRLLDEANQLGGDSLQRAMLLSLAESAAGRLDLAEPAIRKAIQIDPSNATAHYFLARLLYTLNRFDESIDESNKAIALQPGNPRAYENEGLCFEGKQDSVKAEVWYRKAIAEQDGGGKKSEWPMLDLATMMIHQNRYAEAKPLLVQALAINPHNPQSLLQMGTLLAKTDDAPGALMQFRAAIQVDPGMGSAYYQAARICRKLGYTDEADQDFKKFQQLHAKP